MCSSSTNQNNFWLSYTWTHKEKNLALSEAELGGGDNSPLPLPPPKFFLASFTTCSTHLVLTIWFFIILLCLKHLFLQFYWEWVVSNIHLVFYLCVLRKLSLSVCKCQNQVNKCALIIYIFNKYNTWTGTQSSKLSHASWGWINKRGLAKPHQAASRIKTTGPFATPYNVECRQSGFKGCKAPTKLRWWKSLH